MNSFLLKLSEEKVLVSDGAIGSLLFEKGLKSGDSPERVNLKNPEILTDIAKLYVNAGADIIQTNTFGASPIKLSDYDLENRMKEINQTAVDAVNQAVSSNVFISGSVGPTGKMLLPYGELEPFALEDNYEKQIKVLVDSGVNLICIETMTDLNEAIIAVKSARKVSKSIPIIATMTFDVLPQGCMTIMGNSVQDGCIKLEEAGANIVGSNCGNGTNNMIKIAKEFVANTNLPIMIQSNAGMPNVQDDKVTYRETPEQFAVFTQELFDLGISIIGGCCGTTPNHIKAIRKTIDDTK